MKFTNKSSKTLITSVSIITVSVLILTGTFAWRTIQTAITAGRAINFHYFVKLMNEDHPGVYQHNNWQKNEKLDKPIYATSSYLNTAVQTEYDSVTGLDAGALFSNTWVRIKVTERFERNGVVESKQATKLDANKQLVSSFTEDDGGYFSFINNDADLEIIDIADWNGERGRFWILDTTSTEGWLYWAEPLLATTIATDEGTDKLQQTTTNIIDEVALTKQPSGSWDYQITATLEAMDVQLQDYDPDKAGTPWKDVARTHKIYEHLLSDAYVAEYDWDGTTLMITSNTFPDAAFLAHITNPTRPGNDNILPSSTVDGKLSVVEREGVDKINVGSTNISNLRGLEHFPKLKEFRATGMPNLTSIDVSKNEELTQLYAHTNPLLSELEVSNNDKLTTLWAHTNPLLSSLDVSKNELLTELRAYNNPLLSSLNVSNNDKLTYLSTHTNPLLTSLNVSMLENLTTLTVRDSNLTSITLGSHPELTTFRIEGNRLSSLSISGLPVELQTVVETGTFIINPQYQATGGKTVGNQRQNATYDAGTKTLTWE